MTAELHAPAPATLADASRRNASRRDARALLVSAMLHLAGLAVLALVLNPSPARLPAPLPVELVPPEELAATARAGQALPELPRIELPTTLGAAGQGMTGPGLPELADSWPGVPVRIRPPRLSASSSQGLRAPDLPPPIPAMEGYDLESALQKADAAPGRRPVAARSHPDNPPPLYPDSAKRLGLQGEAVVRVTVAPDGTPEKLILVESSGWSVLDDAALETVRQWRFLPGQEGGAEVRTTIELPIVFSLNDG